MCSGPSAKTNTGDNPCQNSAPARKGFTYYFNSTSIRGRANVAKATLTGMVLGWTYYKFTKYNESKQNGGI